MIKPPKILSYFLIICLIYMGISLLMTNGETTIGHLKIKWISLNILLEDLIPPPNIITESLVDSLDTKPAQAIKDTIIPKVIVNSRLLRKFNNDNDLKLQYPESFRTLLHQFYKNILTAQDSDKVVRILHMGDSQIEGDRITRYLRASFQEDFGGTGPGFIPLYDPQKHYSAVWVSNTGKWKEHLIYEYPRTIANNEYGLTGKVATIDSSGWSSINVSKSRSALQSARKYYQSRLFVKNIETPLIVNAYWGNTLISSDSLTYEENITEINWAFKQTPSKFSVRLNTEKSPLFLGMALDSLSGVAVDNISMRGQSSPRLDKNNKELFEAMASYLDIGMIVLQYGTNMVPTVAKNYNFYYKTLYKQLLTIKETIPNVPVVIVSVGDVAFVDDGEATSYSHIYHIKEAQKKAAFKAGFAFFDLYEVMGGKGAIIEWANGMPHLAMSDYTHFNKKGGKLVADWIYKSIMADLKNLDNEGLAQNKNDTN